MKKVAFQQHKNAEKALQTGLQLKATHYYIDISVKENTLSEWNDVRIEKHLNKSISPIIHGDGTNAISHPIDIIRKASVEYVKSEIDLAGKLNCPYILHAGQVYTTGSMDEHKNIAFNEFILSYKDIVKHANTLLAPIWVENLASFENHYPFSNMLSSIECFKRLKKIDKNVSIIFDVGHFNLSDNNHSYFFEEFSNNICAVSLSDNDSIRDMHASLGAGNIDWKKIKKYLPRNWQGLVIFETKSQNILEDKKYFEQV